MNRPRIVGPLKPTTGPVISPIEVCGTELIVSTGATLPPVCIATGQKMEMREAKYLPDFIPLEMEAIGDTGYKKVYQASGQSMVRLPFSKEGLRSHGFHHKVKIAVAIIFSITFPLCAVLDHRPPGLAKGLQLILILVTGFSLLWFLFTRRGTNLTARPLSDGKIAISGIDIHILQSMLEWQQENSKIQTP